MNPLSLFPLVFFFMLLSEAFSTFTSFEPGYPASDPVGNFLESDPK